MGMLRNLLLLFMFSMGNAQTSSVCPNGWTNFGTRCFKYFPQMATWYAAEKNCQNLGGHLASSHSKPENDFMLSLLPSYTTQSWLGAHDGEEEGKWLWTDGSVYDFTNWCPREPNNRGPENCVFINWTSDRCWNDISCYNGESYICAKDL